MMLPWKRSPFEKETEEEMTDYDQTHTLLTQEGLSSSHKY